VATRLPQGSWFSTLFHGFSLDQKAVPVVTSFGCGVGRLTFFLLFYLPSNLLPALHQMDESASVSIATPRPNRGWFTVSTLLYLRPCDSFPSALLLIRRRPVPYYLSSRGQFQRSPSEMSLKVGDRPQKGYYLPFSPRDSRLGPLQLF